MLEKQMEPQITLTTGHDLTCAPIEPVHSLYFDFGISKDYVPHWNYTHGIRELVQNAIDGDSKGFAKNIDYNEDDQTLTISNKGASIERQFLALGRTNKRNDDSAIGTHGEGMCVGIAALLRDDKKVIINNGSTNEQWEFRFIENPKLGCETLNIIITEDQVYDSDDLVVAVYNLSPEEWDECKKVFLEFKPEAINYIETSYGQVLTDKSLKGDIYVNGIFVSNYSFLIEYGYNIKPKFIKLDRDRGMLDNFSVQEITSKIWSEISDKDDQYHELVIELCKNKAGDVYHVQVLDKNRGIKQIVVDDFKKTYGENAYPVSDPSEEQRVKKVGRKPVYISSYDYRSNLKSSLGDIDSLEDSVIEKLKDSHIPLSKFEVDNLEWAKKIVSLYLKDIPKMELTILGPKKSYYNEYEKVAYINQDVASNKVDILGDVVKCCAAHISYQNRGDEEVDVMSEIWKKIFRAKCRK